MTGRLSSAFALFAVLVACRKDDVPSSSSSGSGKSEWSDFYGIQYKAPPGTSALAKNGVLPGPGGQGGIPSGERPSVVLTKPSGFYVEIVKPAKPVSLEGMMYSINQNKIGSNMNGKATPNGWELTYETAGTGAGPTKTHILYMTAVGGYYQCTYDESTCADAKAAEAICRSMKPKG